MFRYARPLVFAAALSAAPFVVAQAQQNNPAGNLGSNRSMTAAPGTADSQAASGMHTADTKGHSNAYGGASMNKTSPRTPGATGTTVVPGNNSTVASDAKSSYQQKTAGSQTGSGGGGR